MQKFLESALLCGLALWVGTGAQAIPFNAEYELASADVVAFMFEGRVQPDGDTVVIDGLLMEPTFNGAPPPLGAISGFLSYIDGLSGLGPGDPTVVPAAVSFSANVLDLLYFNDFPDSGFLVTSESAPAPGRFSAGRFFTPTGGDYDESFSADRWSLTVKALEPATGGALVVGLAALVVARRRAG